MYECHLYRINIKGINSFYDKDKKVLKLNLISFISNKYLEQKDFEYEKHIFPMILDLNNFKSETHKEVEKLIYDLSKVKYFQAKNVMIEHIIEDNFESVCVLSTKKNSPELVDKLAYSSEIKSKNKTLSTISLNKDYFFSLRDSLFEKNSFIDAPAMLKEESSFIKQDVNKMKNQFKFKEEYIKEEPIKIEKPFSSKRDYLIANPIEKRKKGSIILIKPLKQKVKYYQFVDGVEDKDLKLIERG